MAASTVTYERIDTATGAIERVQIPADMHWSVPMTRQQLADRLGIHRDTLATWIASGEIEVRSVGTLLQCRPWDLGGEAFAESLLPGSVPESAEVCGIAAPILA